MIAPTMNVLIKDIITMGAIITKGTPNKEATIAKGVTTPIKNGGIAPTKVGGTIINKEEGTMEATKDGTTLHKTAIHKTLQTNNQIKEGTIKPTYHLIDNHFHPTNPKHHKLPTLLYLQIKMTHSDPYSKDKRNSKTPSTQVLMASLLLSKLSLLAWSHLLPPLLKLQTLVPYLLNLYPTPRVASTS